MAAETEAEEKKTHSFFFFSFSLSKLKKKKQTPASARFRATGTKAAAASTMKKNEGEILPELEAYLRLVGGRDASGSSSSPSTSGASAADCDHLRANPASAEAWWRFLAAEERAAAAAAPGGKQIPPPPPLMLKTTTTTTTTPAVAPSSSSSSSSSSPERASCLALLRLYETATRLVPRGNTSLHALSRLWLGLARRTWSHRCVDDGRDALKALRSSSRLGARDGHLWAQWALLEAFCGGGGGASKGLSVVDKGRAAGAAPAEALDDAAGAISAGAVPCSSLSSSGS